MFVNFDTVARCVKRLRNSKRPDDQLSAVMDVVRMTEAATREDIARAAERDGYLSLAQRIREGWPHGSQHG